MENGKEAVKAVQNEDSVFDAIVLDIDMPVMDGWHALQAIRLLPKGRSIPIVMFTGNCFPEIKVRALQSGADRLVCKPLMPQELAAVLHEVAPRRPASEA